MLINNKHFSKYETISQIKEFFDSLRLDKSELTIKSYSDSLDRFFDYAKVTDFDSVKKVTSAVIRSYQAELKNSGLASSSINAMIRPIKVAFNWLTYNDYLDKSPVEKVKMMKEGTKMSAYFSDEEVAQLLSASKNIEEKTLFAILLSTGLRRDELVNLKVEDVTDYNILVTKGKGDKQRRLSMPEDVYELFQEYMIWRNKKYGDNPYVFVSKAKTKYSGESIRMKLKVAMKRAGFSEERITQLHPHSFRHFFCSSLISNGVDIKVAQIALGHSSVDTTSRVYAHLSNSTLENVLRNQKPIV